MAKMTPWFDAETLPARPGFYKTRCEQVYDKPIVGYSFWDGKRWSAQFRTLGIAARNWVVVGMYRKEWRGLAMPPNVGNEPTHTASDHFPEGRK
jgi:hypothetical protein